MNLKKKFLQKNKIRLISIFNNLNQINSICLHFIFRKEIKPSDHLFFRNNLMGEDYLMLVKMNHNPSLNLINSPLKDFLILKINTWKNLIILNSFYLKLNSLIQKNMYRAHLYFYINLVNSTFHIIFLYKFFYYF